MNQSSNPLLTQNFIPQFNIICAEQVASAVDVLTAEVSTQLSAIEKVTEATWEAVFAPLDIISETLERTWGPVGHLVGVKNSPAWRAAYEQSLPKLIDLNLRLEQSAVLYQAAVAMRANKPYWNQLSETQQRIIERRILSAENSGVALTGASKGRFNAIARELSELTTKFSNNVLDAIKSYALVLTDREEVRGLPDHVLRFAAQNYHAAIATSDTVATPEHGPWRFTLDGPSYIPFMEFSERRDLRKELFLASATKASAAPYDNTAVLSAILRLRLEEAKILGYKNFAELSLATKMAGSKAKVYQLLEDLLTQSKPAAEKELVTLQKFAADRGFTETLAHWDIAFWARTMRDQLFAYTEEELRPYFPMPKVLTGFFALLTKLFDVTIHQAPGIAQVWHSDVSFYQIKNSAGEIIAGFYLDPYSRPAEKRGGAWMDVCSSLKVDTLTGEKVVYPIAYLICNGTPPIDGPPSLMDFNEVRTLFHEFGHGLQHMLTTVVYLGAAGISCVEWDAVELPSQFMENWLYHEPTLLSLTAHFETGEVLPQKYIEKIMAAKNYRAGTAMVRQIQFALTDMDLYAEFDPNGGASPFDVQMANEEKASVLKPLPENRMLCSFSHIFAGGYAAGYYSYKWAEVLSADAFEEFVEAGLDDENALQKTGRRFRDTVLAQGGSAHPLKIFKDFRGREPQIDALVKAYGLK